ncbi:MAG: hypothetical protein BWK76_11385 [Desulfobulbaceae bacterium A2]|nr:MAG: hypothetical protein BWK76_11385 [Desulfobulbaceae bacterium A2]
MRKFFVVPVLAFLLVFSGLARAQGYNLVGIDEFKGWLEGKRSVHIVDIQPQKDFQKQHFADSIQTRAFPLESEEQLARLDKGVEAYTREQRDVVIIFSQGKQGAERAFDYLKSKGIPTNRLFILTGGMASWPYSDLLIKEGCG